MAQIIMIQKEDYSVNSSDCFAPTEKNMKRCSDHPDYVLECFRYHSVSSQTLVEGHKCTFCKFSCNVSLFNTIVPLR